MGIGSAQKTVQISLKRQLKQWKNKQEKEDAVAIRKMLNRKNIKFVLIGIISSMLIFLIFGIPTDTIPNRFYARMIPATTLDVFFLVAVSLMLGTYIGLLFYLKQRKKKQKNAAAYTGAFAGFLAIACPICICLLVLIFGTAALMTYLQPSRPYLGILSIALIGFGIYREIETIKSCKKCMSYKKPGKRK